MDELTLLEDHSHGTALVKNTQLALGSLLVRGIGEDTAVEEGSVSIGNHGSDVTGRVRLLAVLDGIAPLLGGGVPVLAVALVGRVDRPLLGHLHVGVCKDELAERVVHSETVDGAILHGEDELSGSTVHGETCSDKIGAGAKEVLLGALGILSESVDTEDGTNRHTSVQVAGAVNGIASNSVLGVGAGGEFNGLVLLFRDQDAHSTRRAHGRDENVVANHIELFLVITGGVRGACETGKVDQAGATDVVGNRFEGELESVAEEAVQKEVSNIASSFN